MEDIRIKNLPCYPDDLPDIEVDGVTVNDLFKTDFPCENCEHWVSDYEVREGPYKIGDSMKCDKDVWSEDVC